MTNSKLDSRVVTAAEAVLTRQKAIAAVDVLCGIGWLHPTHVDTWRKGRVDCLETLAAVPAPRLVEAMRLLHQWAVRQGLVPNQVDYVGASRDRRPLRFTVDADSAVETLFRTHWTLAGLTEAQRKRVTKKQTGAPDLLVIQSRNDFTCTGCGGTDDLLMMEEAGPICMTCADMDHLVFLPSGDATLTRRAKKASVLSAVVVRFNRSRRRYERQGILVETQAVDQAEEQCLADEELRLRRRDRDRVRREAGDIEFQARLTDAIVRLFPGCPPSRAEQIADHTGLRGSGRVGRSAAGRALDENAVTAAVVASVRHTDTPYDELLMSGVARQDARDRTRPDIDRVLDTWRHA
jgi:hypothetical protein